MHILQYGLPNRFFKYKKPNPIGKNGKVILCRQRGSPEHFIREYPEARTAAFVNLVLDVMQHYQLLKIQTIYRGTKSWIFIKTELMMFGSQLTSN